MSTFLGLAVSVQVASFHLFLFRKKIMGGREGGRAGGGQSGDQVSILCYQTGRWSMLYIKNA